MDSKRLYRAMAESHPDLRAGRVRCQKCGAVLIVDSAACLRSGWPRCCGETMHLMPAGKERGDGRREHD